MNRILASALSSLLLAIAGASLSSAETPAPQVPAVQLVRETVHNEVASGSGIKHIFRDHKKTLQGSQTRIYVETRDGMAGMTVAYNDKPLSTKQLEDEKGRLAGLMGNPEQLRRKAREQKEDADRSSRIVRALPDAFVYDYDGVVPGTAAIGREGVNLIRLKFRPNPGYRPPSHVEEVLLGMKGTILIDPQLHRIAEIDGMLFQQVSFGWGILGHLDKGGHFLVDQADVGDNSWEMSRMSLAFTGKILLFKNLSIKSEELFTNFHRVPTETTFADGVKMLETECQRFMHGPETAEAQKISD